MIEQLDEKGSFFESAYQKRFYFKNYSPAERLCAMLQADASLSLPAGTRREFDKNGDLVLTGRHGDVEVLHDPTAWTFRAAVKRLHQLNDAKEGLR